MKRARGCKTREERRQRRSSARCAAVLGAGIFLALGLPNWLTWWGL